MPLALPVCANHADFEHGEERQKMSRPEITCQKVRNPAGGLLSLGESRTHLARSFGKNAVSWTGDARNTVEVGKLMSPMQSASGTRSAL